MALGSDISGVRDIDLGLGVATGRLAYAQAIARRLTTPAGTLFYDRNYGHDVRQYSNAAVLNPEAIANAVTSEARKDERTADADARVVFFGDALVIDLTLDDGDGPFELTINVSSLNVSVLLSA